MKIKKPKSPWTVIRTDEGGQTKWYAGDKSYKQAGMTVMTGKVIDITDTIEPYINHCNSEVNMLTDMVVYLIDETLRLRGLTVTERDRCTVWQELKTKFRRGCGG